MIRLTLKQLAAIKELAAKRSFTAAAARLHTTQSNLSTTIQEAEHLLGVRLFDRNTKAVSLTEAGAEFATGIARLLADLERHIENAQAIGQVKRGQLAVGVTPLLSSTVIPDVLATFHARHPDIVLRVADDATATLLTLLERRDVELAVGTFDGKSQGIRLQLLCTDELVLLSHPDARLPKRLDWSELPAQRLVSIVGHSSVGQLIESTLLTAGVARLRPVLESHHWLTVLSLARALKCACVVPSYAIGLQQAEGMNVSRLVKPIVTRRLQAASVQGREPTIASKLFIELLKARLTADQAAAGSRRA